MKDKTGIRDRAGVTISDRAGKVVKEISTDVKKGGYEMDMKWYDQTKRADDEEVSIDDMEDIDDIEMEDIDDIDIEDIPVNDEDSASNPEDYEDILDEEGK